VNSFLRDKDTAHDITQDVYLQAIKNFDSLQIEKNIRAWLYRVARNSSINYLKSKKIRYAQEIDEKIPDKTLVGINETSPFIEAAFSQLPERQRMALQMREIDGFSYEDLALHMGLSVSAVTSLLTRARENFQKNYFVNILPESYAKVLERMTNVNDILRYLDPENPPINLFEEFDEITSNYFHKVSDSWDSIRNNFFELKDLKGIFERIDFNYDEKLLDLGTGTGFIALHFAPYVREVTGVDLNKLMLYEAVKNMNRLGIKNASFVEGNIEDLPIYGKKYDLVFCNLVLHHLIDPQNSLKNIVRYLNRDSKFIIVDFKRHGNKEMADNMKDIWLGFDPNEIKRWLSQLSFSKIESFVLKEENKRLRNPEIFCIIASY
jgi:RNA polymerase sigma factor (sigma-70 family)